MEPLYQHVLTVNVFSQRPLEGAQDLDALAEAIAGGKVVSTVELAGPKQIDSAALARLVAATATQQVPAGGRAQAHTH